MFIIIYIFAIDTGQGSIDPVLNKYNKLIINSNNSIIFKINK